MNTRDAFLQAIIAAPDDDAPRLIYADWLEERGQSERADFIRVQCALAAYNRKRCPKIKHREYTDTLFGYPVVIEDYSPCKKCRWCVLKKREEELLDAHCYSWPEMFCFGAVGERMTTYAFPSSPAYNAAWKTPTGVCNCRFRRGFIAEVSLLCSDWLNYGPRLVRQCPLEDVALSDKWPSHRMEQILAGRSPLDGVDYRIRECFVCRPGDYYATAHDHHYLPEQLFSFLPSESFDGGNACCFVNVLSAQAALSQACLAWAKAQPVSTAHSCAVDRPEIAAS